MKLSVLKNNQVVNEVDLAQYVGSNSKNLTFFMGRADTCVVELPDPQISREHAELIYDHNKWSLKSLSPLAKVIHNGSPVDEVELHNGDTLNVGQFLILVNIVDNDSTETLDNIPEPTPVEENVTETQEEIVPVEEEDITETETADFGNETGELETPLEEEPEEDFTPSEESDDEDPFADDGGFGDDSFGGELEETGDKTTVIKLFSNFELLIKGRYAPYDSYTLEDGETKIGRDKDCQIVLGDGQVSHHHATIIKNGSACKLIDNNSGNGTLIDGKRINSTLLVDGSTFVIGSTKFTLQARNALLDQEAERLMPVEENQSIDVEEIEEVSNDFSDGEGEFGEFGEAPVEQPKSLIGKFKLAWKDPQKRKKILLGLVLLVGAYVALAPDPQPVKPKQKVVKDSGIGPDGKAKVSKIVASKKLTPEQLEFVSSRYELAKEFFDTGRYSEALMQLEAVSSVDPNYKQTQQLIANSKVGIAQLEEIEKKRQKEIEEKERQAKIKLLLDKATKVVDEHRETEAKEYFNQILTLDPENYDVQQLKMRLDAWVKEQERIEMERIAKEEERKRRVAEIIPSRNAYNKEEWFDAIQKLNSFLQIKSMDQDLIDEANKMLAESKENLARVVDPLIGKARSFKEGQDLKGAYEHYLRALEYDPINAEAINEMNEIRETLTNRARQVYRQALVSESLSLFEDAKSKFQEVQQIAPTDNEYYLKATEKLKSYME